MPKKFKILLIAFLAMFILVLVGATWGDPSLAPSENIYPSDRFGEAIWVQSNWGR